MSRKTTTIKALVAAGAVAGAAFGLAPAHAADTTAMTITKVGPVKAALGVESPITITGKAFDTTIDSVQFGSDAACASTKLVVVSSTTLQVTAPTDAKCAAGVQSVKLLHGTDALNAAFAGTEKTSITFIKPVDTTGTLVSSPATGVAGTEITITGLADVPTDKPITATLGGKALTGVKAAGATSIKGKVPAGLAPGVQKLVVSNGVSSKSADSGFTNLLTVKVTGNVYLASETAAHVLKVDGLGFKPSDASKVTATVCGVDATVASAASGTGKTAVKAPTNSTLYVTAPDFKAASAGKSDGSVGGTDGADGGVCVVRVTVDTKGDTSGTTNASDDVVSVVTASSGIVYAAY
jgi:hypothetical protein